MFSTVLVASLLVFSSVASSHPLRRQATSPDNGSCEQLQKICQNDVDIDVSNPWLYQSCVFGAACFGGQHPVDDFLAAVFSAKNNGTNTAPPASVNEPRLTETVFKQISTSGTVVSQQNWIDGYYRTLDITSGPYPTNVSVVIADYDRIATWTGFCKSNIPYNNLADYYQYSASVSSDASC